VADKDKKFLGIDPLQGPSDSHPGPSPDASTQQVVALLLSILEQVKRQGGSAPVVTTTQTELERNASFAGAAFSIVDRGLAFQPGITFNELAPTGGPLAGGTPVTIIGSNFIPGATVTFGTRAADDVVVVSPTEIRAKTPPGIAAGLVDVTVRSFGGERPRVRAFTYS
jgi:hypothetical protein